MYSLGMQAAIQWVRLQYPSVAQITPRKLASWLREADRPPPLVLDVRSPAEYRISHLPGAERLDPVLSTKALIQRLGEQRALVFYGSIGNRSSALADRLRKAGRTNVYNLEGSIFEWANEGRPLVRQGRVVLKVHPHNRRYGKLLRPDRRADVGGRRGD